MKCSNTKKYTKQTDLFWKLTPYKQKIALAQYECKIMLPWDFV